MTEEELQNTFSLFGGLLSVKCLPSRGCAFVQFSNAAAAKAAMTMLQEQARTTLTTPVPPSMCALHTDSDHALRLRLSYRLQVLAGSPMRISW